MLSLSYLVAVECWLLSTLSPQIGIFSPEIKYIFVTEFVNTTGYSNPDLFAVVITV